MNQQLLVQKRAAGAFQLEENECVTLTTWTTRTAGRQLWRTQPEHERGNVSQAFISTWPEDLEMFVQILTSFSHVLDKISSKMRNDKFKSSLDSWWKMLVRSVCICACKCAEFSSQTCIKIFEFCQVKFEWSVEIVLLCVMFFVRYVIVAIGRYLQPHYKKCQRSKGQH